MWQHKLRAIGTNYPMASASHKSELVARLLQAKAQSGKTFSQIAVETGLTNAYVGQLFHRQAQLQSSTAEALRNAVPALTHDLLLAMMEPPRRSFDPSLLQDPTVYRFHEAVMHYGETFKAIINEEFGDGIMSAIGFHCTIDKAKGKAGEDRVVVTFNGKYLPHTEQKTEDIVQTIKPPCT